jgi:hypothetical protein
MLGTNGSGPIAPGAGEGEVGTFVGGSRNGVLGADGRYGFGCRPGSFRQHL